MFRRCATRLFATKPAGLVTVAKDTVDPRIAVVTLNNPDKLNALSVAMGDEFKQVCADLAAAAAADAGDLRAVVLTGAGRAFSAGGDLEFLYDRVNTGKAMTEESSASNKQTMLDFYYRFLSVKTIPVPVVAAVNGHAVGAGLCLAMAADLRICAQAAKLSVNFTNIGIHPGMAASHHLPKLVGPQQAAKMILTGNPVSGDEAVNIGLCLKAVPQDAVLPEALDLARSIIKSDAMPINQAVQTLRDGMATVADATDRESSSQARNFGEGGDGVAKRLDAIVARAGGKK